MSLQFQNNYGLVRQGTVESYDQSAGTMSVVINTNTSSYNAGLKQKTVVKVPYTIAYNNGLMIGAKPVKGTPVSVILGEGNIGYFVQFLPQGTTLNKFPIIDDNELVLSSSKLSFIKLNTSNEIYIGNKSDGIKISTPNKQIDTYISSSIDNEYLFNQGKMVISGLVRREVSENYNYIDKTRLKNDDYMQELKIIGMDYDAPISITTGINKNPPFVEHREITYEFALDSEVEGNVSEQLNYTGSPKNNTNKTYNDRRNSRANTLNLNIYNSNTLIEEIKGTVVDIFGNLLDINRSKLVLDKHLSSTGNNVDNFLSIKENELRTVSYHFEINSRKNNVKTYDGNDDLGKHRSNFLFDVDKEGLFKLNIPASSEKGNIPLLTRNINASILTDEKNGLIVNSDKIDIQLDSFASAPSDRRVQLGLANSDDVGVIKIMSGNNSFTPIDRLSSSHMNYGTAYHDILDTCFTQQTSDYYSYLTSGSNNTITISSIPTDTVSQSIAPLSSVISDTINFGVNSGGRSGSINFDGSIDVNVGANTIDKQSLLLDTQGGIIANIGKDKRGISGTVSLDGSLIMKIGGGIVNNDSRFVENIVGGVLDINIVNSNGQAAIIRFDDNGLTISTPGRTNIHSGQDMNITSDSKIQIESETLVIQGRLVHKEFGNSI